MQGTEKRSKIEAAQSLCDLLSVIGEVAPLTSSAGATQAQDDLFINVVLTSYMKVGSPVRQITNTTGLRDKADSFYGLEQRPLHDWLAMRAFADNRPRFDQFQSAEVLGLIMSYDAAESLMALVGFEKAGERRCEEALSYLRNLLLHLSILKK